MHYQDFVLSFSSLEGNRVEVQAESPCGHRNESCVLPFDQLDQSFWRCAADEPVEPGSKQSALATGERLYRAVFSGEIGQLFSSCLGMAGDQGGVRIVLSFDPEDQAALIRLPWETLFNPHGNSSMALSVRTPILRHIQTPDHRKIELCGERMRILVVASKLDNDLLDLERERKIIEEIFADEPRVVVASIEPRDVQELREALRKEETHILHYMGHSDFDLFGKEGRLYLGRTPVTGDQLSEHLQDISSLRLIFLNACHSARDSRPGLGSPFAGLAPALLRRGFPAVLAMSRAISDRGAIAFSRKFYRHLGNGDFLSTAVSEGRLAISACSRRPSEWVTPILFTNHSDARLLTESGPGPVQELSDKSEPQSEKRSHPIWIAASVVLSLAAITWAISRGPREFTGNRVLEENWDVSNLAPPPHLILSEVVYDLPNDDDGREYVELYNADDKPIDLAGFSLGFGGTNYAENRVQLRGVVEPGETFVVGGPISDEINGWPTYQQEVNFAPDIQNSDRTTADGVALFNAPANSVYADTWPIDSVRYGPRNASRLLSKTGDRTRIEVKNADAGASIERRTVSGLWRITSKPDPNRVRFEDLGPAG